MATLTIRNLDDDRMARLRLRAGRHGQSMDEEACSILRAALANGVEDGSGASLYAAIRAYVDIRGRSRTLHINYRTSHQIRMQADRLLAPEVSDVDGNVEERRGTVSVFNGPAPTVKSFPSADGESAAVGDWLRQRINDGIAPQELGVFVRSPAELDRARAALVRAELPFKVLDDHTQTTPGHVSICTMHLAKGLEFRAVVVMACDDEVVPLQQRIELVTDDADLEEVYNTERHLLYVACTRARDQLMVSGVEPVSEFLDDLIDTR